MVGSRDAASARAWADANQVAHAADYAGALARDDVDAVYIALPNSEHTVWAARAVATGRAVVCEKPLGVDTADTQSLLAEVPQDALLWEAFVFPFHPQTDVIRAAMAELGEVREIISEFHFTAGDPANIRWQADLAGGATASVSPACSSTRSRGAAPRAPRGATTWRPIAAQCSTSRTIDDCFSRPGCTVRRRRSRECWGIAANCGSPTRSTLVRATQCSGGATASWWRSGHRVIGLRSSAASNTCKGCSPEPRRRDTSHARTLSGTRSP